MNNNVLSQSDLLFAVRDVFRESECMSASQELQLENMIKQLLSSASEKSNTRTGITFFSNIDIGMMNLLILLATSGCNIIPR